MTRSRIHSLLIANRGEIAVRIARTAREMGIEPVGVYAENDAASFHLSPMARILSLGSGTPLETYLSIPRMLEAARAASADAVHPGYGFLSENADFARAVKAAGLVWIGPPPDAIESMGDKLVARRRMREAGVPVVPGSEELGGEREAANAAREIGLPLLVKASAGGGGKGMKRVDRVEDLASALEETRRIAISAFADGRLYLERLFDRPRHIEFQVFGDHHGNMVHLFERECSVQRRHQKIVEETPSAALDPRRREAMGEAAVAAARAAGYAGAGTVEFLLAEDGRFYFLEMNTRLQVEHPVTEETLGIDLVRAQIETARGAPLPAGWRDRTLSPRGHSIELRLYAEDPVEFLPRSGELAVWEEPAGPGVRVDSGVGRGSSVGLDYDPLLAKLIVSAGSRDAAIERARRALSEWVVLGVETNLPLLRRIVESEEFASGRYATDLVTRIGPPQELPPSDAHWIAAALALTAQSQPSRSDRRRSVFDPWEVSTGWRPGA